MHQESNRPGWDADNQHHGDNRVDRPLRGTAQRVRPHISVPPTVLVVNLGDRSLVLETWRDGPRVYLSPADAVPLRRELAAVFESTVLALPTEQDETR